jgi:hypothetical protein
MWMKVKRGVSQGLILGPLLFILYINDVPNSIIQKATPIIFADDTSILITGQDTNKLQEDLTLTFTQVLEWFNLLAPELIFTFLHTLYLKCE